MDEHSTEKRDIIREFCRSQGAPTAYWLARLNRDGQRECIRQWIVRSRGPEIYNRTHAVVEQLYEEHANDHPHFYDALSAEDIKERVEHAGTMRGNAWTKNFAMAQLTWPRSTHLNLGLSTTNTAIFATRSGNGWLRERSSKGQFSPLDFRFLFAYSPGW